MGQRIAWAILAGVFLLGCSGPYEWSPQERRFFEALSTPYRNWSETTYGLTPNPYERTLLKTYKPRVFISPRGIGPVDFYEDYLPQTELVDHTGKVASRRVNRMLLKAFERSPGFSLRFRGPSPVCIGEACRNKRTRGYGQVYYGDVDLGEGVVLHYQVLKYNFVFPYSGLPARLSRAQEWLSGVVGDPKHWHDLDLHGAIHVFVEGSGGEPFMVLLAQHNHFRTYLVGSDIMWSPEAGLRICFAERSNEPYPCPLKQATRNVPAAATPDHVDFLFGKGDGGGGLFTGHDLVVGEAGGATPIDYDLAYLPSEDPLYTAWIPLGGRRGLGPLRFFQSGPPGMNFKFNPKLKTYFDIAQFFSFVPGDRVALRLAKEQSASMFSEDYDFMPLYRWNGRALRSSLKERFFSGYSPSR
ncbi:MAG: hypothetical protein H6624_03010 [Bdellovibrionaceae bacterium]|nr:hypothetical protein [Bdellovibrionales bacterium]MCB9083283.1 hypothetical protein [Pseudobdellovibrionaceae bacterium]